MTLLAEIFLRLSVLRCSTCPYRTLDMAPNARERAQICWVSWSCHGAHSHWDVESQSAIPLSSVKESGLVWILQTRLTDKPWANKVSFNKNLYDPMNLKMFSFLEFRRCRRWSLDQVNIHRRKSQFVKRGVGRNVCSAVLDTVWLRVLIWKGVDSLVILYVLSGILDRGHCCWESQLWLLVYTCVFELF